MPCDTIQTNRVQLADNVRPELLAKAMSALGFQPREYLHDVYSKRVTIFGARGQNVTQAQVAQAYSAEVVKSTAAKNGWKLKQVAPFKYQVTRGGI